MNIKDLDLNKTYAYFETDWNLRTLNPSHIRIVSAERYKVIRNRWRGDTYEPSKTGVWVKGYYLASGEDSAACHWVPQKYEFFSLNRIQYTWDEYLTRRAERNASYEASAKKQQAAREEREKLLPTLLVLFPGDYMKHKVQRAVDFGGELGISFDTLVKIIKGEHPYLTFNHYAADAAIQKKRAELEEAQHPADTLAC